MQDGTIDKLVVDVELSADDFERQAVSVEKRYDGLKKNLDKTSKNVEKRSKKTKKDLSGITKETENAGKAFKKSGKSSDSFFSPMTKGLLGFAAAVYTLKSAVDAVSKVAQKFADVRVEARESGVSESEVRARALAEEKVNIPKGTFVNAVKNIRSLQAEARLGNIPAREQLIVAGAKLGIGGGELIDGDPEKIIQKIIDRLPNLSERFRRDFANKFGVGSYANLNARERDMYNESVTRNRSIENTRQKNGTYEEGVKTREAFVETSQRFERAWEDFATKGMPAIIFLLEGLTNLIQQITHPFQSFGDPFYGLSDSQRLTDNQRKFYKNTLGLEFGEDTTVGDVKRELDKRSKIQSKKNTDALIKSVENYKNPLALSIPNEMNLQHLSSQNSINNTNNYNITQHNKITSNDPVKTAREFATKGINTSRLGAAIVSSQ